MARMPRGEPQSVEDPLGEAYDRMIRAYKADREAGERLAANRRPPPGRAYIGRPGPVETSMPYWGPMRHQIAFVQEGPRIEHPGLAEGMIPVWGSGKEALADLQDGDYLGAALNTGVAASDVFLVGAIGKGVAKGGLGLAKPTWRKARKDLAKTGDLQPYQPGHHAIVPQKGLGKRIPGQIKNHRANIKPMESAEMHGRLHHGWKGKPRFNPIERYVYGTPAWLKALNASVLGRAVEQDKER